MNLLINHPIAKRTDLRLPLPEQFSLVDEQARGSTVLLTELRAIFFRKCQ